MASIQQNHCLLCTSLGETKLTLSKENGILKVRLETRTDRKKNLVKNYGTKTENRDDQKQSKNIDLREYYLLGQDLATTSIAELVDLLLKRDYPQIVVFDGSRDGMVGPIFIPESFIPKQPRVVDPVISQQIKEQFPEDTNLCGEIDHAKSDIIEREVYDLLKKYFPTNEDVVIIHGLDLVKLGCKKGLDVQEIDFLVLNYTHRYILNLEVKTTLGSSEKRLKKDQAQLDTIRTLIEDYFSADLKGNWRYISAWFCKNTGQFLNPCHDCNIYIATNPEELLKLMKILEEGNKVRCNLHSP